MKVCIHRYILRVEIALQVAVGAVEMAVYGDVCYEIITAERIFRTGAALDKRSAATLEKQHTLPYGNTFHIGFLSGYIAIPTIDNIIRDIRKPCKNPFRDWVID